MINTLQNWVEKVDNMCDYIGNFSRDENYKKCEIEMLEN